MSNQASWRVPPNNLEAEASVIAYVLCGGRGALDEVAGVLKPEHFYADAHRRIYEAFVDLAANGRAVDILTTRAWLEEQGQLRAVGGPVYLARVLDSVPHVANIADYVADIVGKWKLRQLIAVCQKISASAYGHVDDVRSFLDSAEHDIYDVATLEDVPRESVTIKSALRERWQSIEERLKLGTSQMVTTGLPEADAIVVGASPGELLIAAARPGVGKSAFVLNQVALHTAGRGMGVFVASLEMPTSQVVDRMLCCRAGVDARLIPQAKLSPVEMSRLAGAAGELAGLPLRIDDEAGIGIAALRGKVRRAAAEFRKTGTELKLVIVDYLQLMSVNERLQLRDQQIAQNASALKSLAKDMGVVVLAVSALNRDAEKRGGKYARPRLSDLRESGHIEFAADSVWMLHDPGEDEDEGGVTPIEFVVAKGRQYGGGICTIGFVKKHTKFVSRVEREEFGGDDGNCAQD